MMPSEWIFSAFVVLTVIHLFVPSARSDIVRIYDAGMFAIYLIVLAWGATRISDGVETQGWGLIIVAAAGFGQRMYFLFNRERE
jgi:hypothetical protein